MMVPFIDQLIDERGDALVDCLEWFLDDPEAFCKALPSGAPEAPLLGSLIRQKDRHFRVLVEPLQLARLLETRNEIASFPYALIFFSLDRLNSTLGIPKTLTGTFGAFSLESNLLRTIRDEGWLHSALFGYRFFCNPKLRSVVEITVRDESGEICTGSGFISVFDDSRWRVITCKHNILSGDGRFHEILQIRSADLTFEPISSLVFDRIDVAIIETMTVENVNPVRMTLPRMLEPVFSAGYPRIHLREPSPLLFHRGEVNGWTGQIEGANRAIVTSCDVSPGSSGGPLFNDLGQAVGVVHRRVETTSQRGLADYALAIPTDQIKHELDACRVTEHPLDIRPA